MTGGDIVGVAVIARAWRGAQGHQAGEHPPHKKNWKFTDFGLSKIVDCSSRSSHTTSGTKSYTSPEQLDRTKFSNTDIRTDIWQMGILISEMLGGKSPSRGRAWKAP
jgi:serine/threonine protein kinase